MSYGIGMVRQQAAGLTRDQRNAFLALTLAARPLGAACFGYWADRRGRRIPLLCCVLFIRRSASSPRSRPR